MECMLSSKNFEIGSSSLQQHLESVVNNFNIYVCCVEGIGDAFEPCDAVFGEIVGDLAEIFHVLWGSFAFYFQNSSEIPLDDEIEIIHLQDLLGAVLAVDRVVVNHQSLEQVLSEILVFFREGLVMGHP